MEEDKTLNNIMTDDFGKIILKIRKEKHLTQKAFAELINVSDRTISKWENGQSVPDLICVKNMCKALGISPSSLVLDKKSKKEHITDFNHKVINFFSAKCILYLIFITLFILLFIFYINNRNTVTMYRLKLTNEDFFVGNSYYIKTKYKNILVINDIRLNRDNDYTSVNLELYTYINGDKKVIYEKNSLENIYIDNFDTRTPYLTKDIINSISKSLYITITINNDSESKQYNGTFSVVEKYQNNRIIKEMNKDDKNTSNAVAAVFKETTINDKLIDMGYVYDNQKDYYFIKRKDSIIKLDLNNTYLSIVTNNQKLFINYYYDKDFVSYLNKTNTGTIYYYHTDDESNECLVGNCKKYYDEIDEILEIYQEIKEIL